MRKEIVAVRTPGPKAEGSWLDLERVAAVEVSSEDPAHPIEGALLPRSTASAGGWRAAEPGPQVVRLRFDAPQRLQRIRLRVDEVAHERTQEFALRWSRDGASFQEIVRQQWTFSPSGATSEIEDYAVDLADVAVLELAIVPHVGGGGARATLTELRVA